MTTEIKAPTFPESVADGTVATWYKKVGEACQRDEILVDIETDKVVLEIVAPNDGVLKEIFKQEGDTLLSEELLAYFEMGAKGKVSKRETSSTSDTKSDNTLSTSEETALVNPAAKKLAQEKNIDLFAIKGTGKGGRITKEDVLNAPSHKSSTDNETLQKISIEVTGNRTEKRVPMTRLRKKVAERLLSAQQNSAMLTTFNEINMKPIMDLRSKYKDLFEKTHSTRLGFMSFFVKACTEALKRFPSVNASTDGNDIVYHGYQDIGVAVSSDRGLVVPILRNAESMNLAKIESTIREYGQKAQAGKLSIDDMTGGTFTISNGGVFGSLLSTPILNPPQSAILGMHKIQERPMAINGKVEILPMMYLALSYDHRMLDGKEAVTFLVAIKDLLEDPARILLEL